MIELLIAMRLSFFDYRYADAVLDHPHFRTAKEEVLAVLQRTPVPLLDPEELESRRGGVKRRERNPLRGDTRRRYFFLPVDQKALNSLLDEAFSYLDWILQPAIVDPERGVGPTTGLKGDYKKGRLQVEAQFGNMARWYTDVFKFQLSYSLDEIDVAILVVPTQRFANLIDENVASFDRVERELPWAKMSLTLPIWVIGVEPDDYGPIEECYESAGEHYAAARAAAGNPVIVIPFGQRLTEPPTEEAT